MSSLPRPRESTAAAFAAASQALSAGRLAEAEQLFRSVLAVDPGHADCLHRLGVISLARGDAESALAACDAAIARRSRVSAYHDSRGDALEALGRDTDAIAAWRQAIKIEPSALAPLVSLGLALTREDDSAEPRAEAIRCFRRALATDPASFPALNGLGLALQADGRLDEAEAALRAALRIAPGYAALHLNLGALLCERGQRGDHGRWFADSEEALTRALALQPGNPAAQVALARLRCCQERYEEAEALLRAALTATPESRNARLLLAFILISSERYTEGWQHYAWRKGGPGRLAPLPGPAWDGSDLAGRTLLVVSDEGFGDWLQMSRFLPLAARGGRVAVQVPKPLMRLALLMDGIDVVQSGPDAPAHDVWCSATDLPELFRVGIEAIPAETPYLRPAPADAAQWRERLAGLPGRRVGLVWGGSRTQKADPLRSIPLEGFLPLAGVAGVSFVSLQKDRPASVPAGLALHDWTAELADFADTAALVSALDLVVTVDTAVAHLAGALGRPVWMLNRWDGATDPRWLRGRAGTPWYPSMRIFRQGLPGAWAPVLEAVREALTEFAA